MIRKCKECQNDFEPDMRDVRRGNGFFCSIKCSAIFNGRLRKSKQILNCVCAYCNKAFHRNTSKQKRSKSGLFFCCRTHKDAAQKIGGISAIQPVHYGTSKGKHDYRERALEKYGATCNRCGYNKNPVAIIVHHKDRNRANAHIDNLEVLCANCHAIEHWTIIGPIA